MYKNTKTTKYGGESETVIKPYDVDTNAEVEQTTSCIRDAYINK